jgi:hypothetical protein
LGLASVASAGVDAVERDARFVESWFAHVVPRLSLDGGRRGIARILLRRRCWPSGDDVAESGEVALLEAGDEAMGEIRVAVIEKQNLIGNLHCFRQALE